MNQIKTAPRILAISLSSPGFGYAVIEGDKALIECGNKVINDRNNWRSLAGIEKMILRNQPDVLVLQDVKGDGVRRWPRIKRLHRGVLVLAKKRKLKTMKISAEELRSTLLGDANGTKHEMAQMLAKRFPDELASRLPPKRKPWTSEDRRMDIFDAVGLAVGASDERAVGWHTAKF